MPLLANFNDTTKNNISVVGISFNEKDGAWLYSKLDKKKYFLDGVEQWEEKDVGKKVKAWGSLTIEETKRKPLKPGEIVPQQRIGVKRIIVKAKWRFVKSYS